MNTNEIENIVKHHGSDSPALIGILQDIQKREGYLSQNSLKRVSGLLDVPLTRLFALATFYKAFSLKPTGRHKISVCVGTACHVRGSSAILKQLERDLGVAPGGTTANRQFTLESVRCLGCCGIGPVIRIDDKTFGMVRQDRLAGILEKFE